MSKWLWLVFVLGTIICWGAYGPTLHKGQMALEKNAWKAILCVGGAYFILAVIGPIAILLAQGESLRMSSQGMTMAGLAGALGAIGAMCIAGSLKTGGTPITVMPLVFGCAPVVNVLVTAWLAPPKEAANPLFYVGILALGIGAALVMYFKPQ